MNFIPKYNIFRTMLIVLFSVLAIQCQKIESDSLSVSTRQSEVTSESGVTFVSVRCGGAWNLYLVSPDGSDAAWATLSVTEGTGSRSNVILTYGENDKKESRELKVVLTADGKDVSCIFKQLAEGQQPSVPDRPGMDVPVGWMELPAMTEGQKAHFYSHHFSMKDKNTRISSRYRNYSFIWDQKNLTSPWVAYPLCKLYTDGNVGRTEAWNYDPSLNISFQPDYHRGIGSGYDRGHQIPSGDRQCSREANEQTFYYTNMTPQLSGLNQKGWSALEAKVRSWASRLDTLYVVTGCVPGSRTVSDRSGNKVNVPSAYYKALLGYKKTKTIGVSTLGYVGLAFYIEHQAQNDCLHDYLTIDELEEKTGIDFFVNLETAIGQTLAAKVESTIDDSFWKIRN